MKLALLLCIATLAFGSIRTNESKNDIEYSPLQIGGANDSDESPQQETSILDLDPNRGVIGWLRDNHPMIFEARLNIIMLFGTVVLLLLRFLVNLVLDI